MDCKYSLSRPSWLTFPKISPPSRSILLPVNPARRYPRLDQTQTTCIISSCYELDGDKVQAQLVYRTIESLDTARIRLGQQVKGTFLRWRLEDEVLLLVVGLGNTKSQAVCYDGLRLVEDGARKWEWYREGRYPTITLNCYPSSLIRHHWGPQCIAEFARGMCMSF